MPEPKINSGGTVLSDKEDMTKAKPAAGGSRTVVAGAAAGPPSPPPSPAAANRTMIASAPPPAPTSPPAMPDMGGGGTMIQSNDSPVPVPVAAQHSTQMQSAGDLTGTTLLGRYTIQKKLGEGGMGTVYLCEHATIGKKFAVKVLSHEFAHKDDLRERFLQEARAASMISQENVVEISDFGDTPDGSVFFVMEHLKGEDLSDTVKEAGRLPWPRVKPIMLQICRALGAAHDAGIIHRDMKPENCYRIKRGSNEDFIKVLDFGIAKVTSEEDGEGKGLTRTGMIFGTPEYMSPEQAQGSKPDHRVDVYAVGVIMYELLTGRVPFRADTFMGIMTKHMFEVPEAPSSLVPEADIPPEAEAIMLKALQKDRELRFANMADMAAAIEAVGTGAAAVEVVNERIARPSTGEMAFTGGRSVTQMPGTVPPIAAEYQEPQRSNKGLMFAVIGALALSAAGIGAFFAFGGDKGDKVADAKDEPKPQDPAAVAGQPKDEPKVDPAPELPPEPVKVKELAAGTETVNYKISTKDPDGNLIEAKILDPLDNAIYGLTNTADGVEVAKSETALKLVITAPNFENMEIEIFPVRDKMFEYTLEPVKKKATPIPKGTTKKPDPKPDPKVDPKPDPKPDDSKTDKPPRRVSPDLKDPFGSKGR